MKTEIVRPLKSVVCVMTCFQDPKEDDSGSLKYFKISGIAGSYNDG